MDAFERYRSGLDERCDGPPAMSFVEEIGSYCSAEEPPETQDRRGEERRLLRGRVAEMKGFPGAALGPDVREALKAPVPAGI